MVRKKTHEEFLEEVKVLVGDEYEVIGEYVNTRVKVSMKHGKCGYKYEVQPNSFLNGSSCPKCSSKKKTTKQFKKEVYNLVGDEYEVLGEYKNSNTKILFKHAECDHKYEVVPRSFLNGNRCPKCFGNHKKTTEQYKKEVYDLVGEEYTVLGEYTNSQKKIKMKHNDCGYEYEVLPSNFLRGIRCPKCSGLMKKTIESFKQEICNLVGNEYSVLGEYVNRLKKIKMKHNKCNSEYSVMPSNFLRGTRCPKCCSSKGEKKVSDFLNRANHSYEQQYSHNNCKNKKPLPFDFAVFNPDKSINCLIEYDGKQHFKPIEHFGGEEGFKGTQKRDQIKNQYCKDNNIKLIRIPYWDFDNIETILNEELKDLIGSSEDCTQQIS